MTSPFLLVAHVLREPGSVRAINIDLMARRLQGREARLPAARLARSLPRAAEARRIGIVRHTCMNEFERKFS